MNSSIPETTGHCPHCAKSLPDYVPNKQMKGSPIRKCPKCGEKYLDKRYSEPALTGIPDDSQLYKAALKRMLAGVVLAAASLGFYWIERNFMTYYHPTLLVIGIISLVIIPVSIAEIISIKTGSKAKRLQKEYDESVERLKNRDYAQDLASLGYKIPDEFLR